LLTYLETNALIVNIYQLDHNKPSNDDQKHNPQ